jgi:hypothetical protein
VADENTGAYLVFSSAREADETNYYYFRRSLRPTKQTVSFLSAALANKNMVCIFVGFVGRRKEMYLRSFSSILFRRPIIYFLRFSSYF